MVVCKLAGWKWVLTCGLCGLQYGYLASILSMHGYYHDGFTVCFLIV
jgi:hypothetical protein